MVRIVDELPNRLAGMGVASVGAFVGALEAGSGEHQFEVAAK